MKTYYELFKKENIVFRLITLAIIAIIALFLCRVVKNTVVGLDFPNELLEPANVHLTNSLLDGSNPYLRENIVTPGQEPPVNYEYPFLGSVLSAAVAPILGGNTVAAHYLVSFLSMIGTAILGAIIIYRYSRTTVGAVTGFLLLLFCHWRYGYISASPDGLGLFVTMVTLYSAVRPKLNHRALQCAILTIVCFYTKQYFAGVCVSIFIFMWCYSKKEALKYFAYCVVLGLISVGIVTAFWPLYWDYSILCLMHGCFHGWNIEGFAVVFEQMKYLTVIFAGMIAVLAVALFRYIKSKRGGETLDKVDDKKKLIKEGDALALFLIQIPVQLAILFVVGRNDGAFLTYFLQLLIPSLVIATLIVLERMESELKVLIYAGCYGIVVLFTVYFGWTKLPMHMLTDEEIANWNRAYALLDEYREKGEVYHYQATAYNAIANGDSVFLTGHDGDITEDTYLEWQGNTIQKVLFPDAGSIYEENLAYREVLREKIRKHEVSMISTGQYPFAITVDDLQNAGYEVVEQIPLQLGNMSYETLFWALE